MINGSRLLCPCRMEDWDFVVLVCWHLLLFLASAAATLELQNEILPSQFHHLNDHCGRDALDIWSKSANIPEPVYPANKIRKVWDTAITSAAYGNVVAQKPTHAARLLAASAPHSGDWLQAPPSITAIGLRLTDEMIRVVVGFRLGANTCEPHQCVCGTTVDARGLHGLCCRTSAPRHRRHSHVNDIVWQAVHRAQIPVVKEPVGLSVNGKRPDGATLFPWSRGKPLAWDVTVPDTFAKSHLHKYTAIQACAAADKAAGNKVTKYAHLATTHMFVPISAETGGSRNIQAVEFV